MVVWFSAVVGIEHLMILCAEDRLGESFLQSFFHSRMLVRIKLLYPVHTSRILINPTRFLLSNVAPDLRMHMEISKMLSSILFSSQLE